MATKFLANENFPLDIVAWLREQGTDVDHAAERFAGAADETVLDAAIAERRVLLTFDQDFGRMVFHGGVVGVPGVVLFRLDQRMSSILLGTMQAFFEQAPQLVGSFTVVKPGGFRQVRLTR
jgi:predicted nuclease of predicted toxin-antitoxin system